MTAPDRGPYYNGSGYPDPTAYEALKTIQAEEAAEADARLHALIAELKLTITERGFELLNRIEVRDVKTGKISR